MKKDIGVLLDAMTVLGGFSAWLGVDGHLEQRFAWSVPERNLLKYFWFMSWLVDAVLFCVGFGHDMVFLTMDQSWRTLQMIAALGKALRIKSFCFFFFRKRRVFLHDSKAEIGGQIL